MTLRRSPSSANGSGPGSPAVAEAGDVPSGSSTVSSISDLSLDLGDNNSDLCDDDEEQDEGNMDGHWSQWANAICEGLGICSGGASPLGPRGGQPAEPLNVGTLCAGTDAPVHSLGQLLSQDQYVHQFSLDNWEPSEDFIRTNFQPQHFYKDINVLLSDHASCCCCICGPSVPCAIFNEVRMDVLTMGFPCTPYSTLNVCRWVEGYDPFQEPAARPIFVLSEWLRKKDTPKPKLLILENVAGLMLPLNNSVMRIKYPTPLAYILEGSSFRMKDGKRKKFRHGLMHVPDYTTKVITLDACTAGLPHRRRRVFIIMVHKDIQPDWDKFNSMLRTVKTKPLKPFPMDDFICESEAEQLICQQQNKRARTRRGTKELVPWKSMQSMTIFRMDHGLPPHSKPFRSTAQKDLLGKLSPREQQMLDCIFELFIKTNGHVPDDLIVNVNEGIARRPWCRGRIRCISTGSKIYYHKIGKLLNIPTKFQLMGWVPDRLVLTGSLVTNVSNVNTLLGNMIAVPTIGTVELLLLVCCFPQFQHLYRQDLAA